MSCYYHHSYYSYKIKIEGYLCVLEKVFKYLVLFKKFNDDKEKV